MFQEKAWGCSNPTFLELFCFLWFAPYYSEFHNDDTEKLGETIATPPKKGGSYRPR